MSRWLYKLKEHGQQSIQTLLIAAFIGGVGTGSLAAGLLTQVRAPQVRAASTAQLTTSSPLHTPAFLPYSLPVQIVIPRIKVDSELLHLGKLADGSLDVPRGDDVDKAAWYQDSPAPGQSGAAVIEGHVDSYKSGPSVFFDLGTMRQGDQIYVRREDGIIARFNVESVQQYSKASFPDQTVFGPVSYPALHLVTCGGSFDWSNYEYDQNVVVYARFIGVVSQLPSAG
jgi:hypothetical protein